MIGVIVGAGGGVARGICIWGYAMGVGAGEGARGSRAIIRWNAGQRKRGKASNMVGTRMNF